MKQTAQNNVVKEIENQVKQNYGHSSYKCGSLARPPKASAASM